MKKTGKAYYMISAVAQKYNIHPQTLRLYEREGLLKPSRTEGNTRLYSEDDLEQLEQRLSTAMIKSSPTELVRSASPAEPEPAEDEEKKSSA